MKACRSSGGWWVTGSALLLGVFASGVWLYGAESEKKGKLVATFGATPNARSVPNVSEQLYGGSGIPANLGLPYLPPIRVDYRNDARVNRRADSARQVIGGGSAPRAGGSVAADTCFFDVQCDDCNPCTINACEDAICAGSGLLVGLPCTADSECGGVCVGGLDDGGACSGDLDCCGDEITADGFCDQNTCLALGSNACRTFSVDNKQIPAPECGDGLECNVSEFCRTISGTPTCVDTGPTGEAPLCSSPQVCDELKDLCVAACTLDSQCSDGRFCNGLEDCVSGVCQRGVSPCGPGGEVGCSEGATEAFCPQGRCCVGSTCSATEFADCAGSWLATDQPCVTDPNTQTNNDCPDYSAGLAPQGVVVVAVGPISLSPCDLPRVGDDYRIPALPINSFLNLHILRFGGHVQATARFAIEFWDSQGRFIEDVFFPDGTNQAPTGGTDPVLSGPAVFQVDFDPPLPIPADGYVSVTVQENFGPDGVFTWFSTTAPPDVGANDDPGMFVDTGPVLVDFLGQCSSGTRPGLWCDRRNGNTDCTGGGTCNNVADTLMLELVGEAASSPPFGACCNPGDGSCTNELEWICGEMGGNFQGAGVFCKLCLGGANNGNICTDGSECTGGDTCQDQLACGIKACCNTTTGACTQVTGAGTPCPVGSTTQGLGSSCSPDCCPQPSGAGLGSDNCLIAQASSRLMVLNVPDLPVSNTVTATRAGHTGAATFDDFSILVCQGGVNRGDSCVDDTGCPGSTCAPICDVSTYDPTGSADPGWWEAFSIDECANVRIDLCCSDPVVRPGYGGVTRGCPCGPTFGNEGVDDPLGEGRGTSGFARGGPFCDDDNLWGTYGPLPPGTYFYSIYAQPDGTKAAGNKHTGGPYQIHVTAAPCPILVCCAELCSGGARAGRPCNPSGMVNCPFGECISNVCVGGLLNGHACTGTSVDQCGSGATCGTTSSCEETDQLECETFGGYWMGAPNTPPSIGNIVDCVSNRCNIGSCCSATGCQDRSNPVTPCNPANPNTCMNESICEGAFGTFVGGPQCTFPTEGEPCPVCSVSGADHCQEEETFGNFTILFNIDWPTNAVRFFDDFIADGSGINQFCWFPLWATAPPQGSLVPCANSAQPPADGWFIRFREDNDGVPGNLLPGSPTGLLDVDDITNKRSTNPLPTGTNSEWDYSIVFNPPIAVSPGTRYWVEVSGSGDPVRSCFPWIRVSGDGNRFGYIEGDFVPPNPIPPPGVPPHDNVSEASRSGIRHDFRWCIDTGGVTDPPDQTGACCLCNGSCTDNVVWYECTGGARLLIQDDEVAFADEGQQVGNWYSGKTCGEISCVPRGSIGGCDPGVSVLGEDCATPLAVSVNASIPYSNFCSATDGPLTYTDCDNALLEHGRTSSFQNDLWFEYTSTCTGVVKFEACHDSDFDGVLAVYTNGTGTCPTASPCTALPEGQLVNARCEDFGRQGCEGADLQGFGNKGVCYLIRVGGEHPNSNPFPDPAKGSGVLRITCETTSCTKAITPLAELHDSNSGPAVNLVASVKNRMLSFDIDDPGQSVAIKVKFVTLPNPPGAGFFWSSWNGQEFWVTGPIELKSEVGGRENPQGNDQTFKIAHLSCNRDDALYHTWSTEGVVHLRHPGFIPGGVYEIRATRDGCLLGELDEFSDPLTLTSPRWGDAVGLFDTTGGYYTTPNGNVGVGTDVTAILNKFANKPGSPIKVRADLEPCLVDFKINITDVTRCLNAFSNIAFPFRPGVNAGPGSCVSTDPCTYTATGSVAGGD